MAQHPFDHNPLSRTNCTWIASELKKVGVITAFDANSSAIITFSGKGPGQDATAEASHVSVWIWISTGSGNKGEFFYTDLAYRSVRGRTIFGKESITKYAFIKYLTEEEARVVGTNVCKAGIYRIWEVSHSDARTAQEYARLKSVKYNELDAAEGKGEERKYSQYFSNTYTRTWNCASYAEKVVRSGGVNVTSGFFITSPLEMTTGNSGLVRRINKKRSGREWFKAPKP